MGELEEKSGNFLVLCRMDRWSHCAWLPSEQCGYFTEVGLNSVFQYFSQILAERCALLCYGARLRIQVYVRWGVSALCRWFQGKVIWSRTKHLKYFHTSDLGSQATMTNCALSPNSAFDSFLLRFGLASYISLGLSLPCCMTKQLEWMERFHGPFTQKNMTTSFLGPGNQDFSFEGMSSRFWIPGVLRSWDYPGFCGTEWFDILKSCRP